MAALEGVLHDPIVELGSEGRTRANDHREIASSKSATSEP